MTTMALSTKSSKPKSKIIVLRLRPEQLAQFPASKQSPSLPTIPAIVESGDKSSDSNGTPAGPSTPAATDGNSLAPPKKGTSAPKTGNKRTAAPSSILSDAQKARARPGPKKKPRLADGSIDHAVEGIKKGPAAGPAANSNPHKLGPKANTGAINAGLRALDRTGKPCRRWQRQGFKLKSFTGVAWSLGAWESPVRDGSSFSGDVKSETSGSSDPKAAMESSMAPSESSTGGDGAAGLSNGVASSPAPGVASGA